MSAAGKSIQFTRHADGCITADVWPRVIMIAKDLLYDPASIMDVVEDLVVLSVANGTVTYEIFDRRWGKLDYVLARLTKHEHDTLAACPEHGQPAPYDLTLDTETLKA